MSNGSDVPPTPGTEPRTGSRRERPYREDPGIYAERRENGSHAYTLDEIDARIMACAADEAAHSGSGPLRPALFRELEGVFWHRLFRDLSGDRDEMARYEIERTVAAFRREAAQENETRFERRARELESRQLRLPHPVTGLTLSRTWFLLACLAPAALIEVIGSTPSIQEAFKLDIVWAVLFAIGISAVLVLTAEQLGNALAAATARSRRLTTTVAALLLVVAMAVGIVAIVSLAQSRETNLSFREAVEASRETRDESGRIGGAAEAASGAGAEAAGSAGSDAGGPTKPDFAFFIPLSILVLTASTLVAFRVEAARDCNDLADRLREARAEAQDQHDLADEERDSLAEGFEGENRVLQGLVSQVEEERNLLGVWIARFEVEYGRFCTAAGVTPRQVIPRPLPELATVLLRILQPLEGGAGRGAEAEAVANFLAGGRENGDGPDDDGDADAGGGVDTDGPGPPDPPDDGAPPELRPDANGRSGSRPPKAFNEQGQPRSGEWRDRLVAQQQTQEER